MIAYIPILQVRSASFDEIQLENQRAAAATAAAAMGGGTGSVGGLGGSLADDRGPLLQVPQLQQQQRSKSFDSASGPSTGDEANTFLEVPRRFQKRRSSNTKTSPPACIHCQYLEEYRRQISADQLFFIDHQEVRTLSYSDTSTSDDDDEDEDDVDEDNNNHNNNNDEEEESNDNRSSVESDGPQFGMSLVPPGKFPLTLSHGSRLSPPDHSPPSTCNIRFTLSPTTSELPTFIDLESPPVTPNRIPSPPPPFIIFDLDRLVLDAARTDTITAGSPAASPNTCDDDPPVFPVNRSRRRSISRQEAVFVEPTKDSLENVAGESGGSSGGGSRHREGTARSDTAGSSDEVEGASGGGYTRNGRIPSIRSSDDDLDATEEYHASSLYKHLTQQDNVRDIFLTVPDLKRDRAASVDSCFTKVHSSGKTEEVQPPPDGGLTLTVPTGSAVRSRSVDIVLPTNEQARYKALALAGPNSYGQYSKG